MRKPKYKLVLNDTKTIYFSYFTDKIFDFILNEKWDLFKLNGNNYELDSKDVFRKLNKR